VQRGIGLSGIAGFIVLSLLIGWVSGRLGQRLFDDEVLTLAAIDGRSYGELIRLYLGGGDVHPPLPFLWFRLLQDLQLPIWLQRGLSLALAAGGFALVLDLVWRRLPDSAVCRALAIVLFLGAPLLYGMGASLRWYPLLVLPVALAFWSALNAGRSTLLAAIGFGVAANISFLAIIPAFAFVVWRYLLMRRFDGRQDGRFLIVALLFALPGLLAFVLSARNVAGQIDANVLTALGMTMLGVIGGYGLGLTQALIAIPFALLCVVGVLGAVLALRRRPVGDLLVLSLLIALSCLILTAIGFAKPRSFLFAVPFLLAIVTLGGASLSWRRGFALATLVISLSVTVPALWLLNASDRPFKRNLHIPDTDVLAAIRQHAPQETSLIISSEPSLGWQLRKEGYCVIAASLPTTCPQRTAPIIVTIDDGTFTQRGNFATNVGGITANHKLVHQMTFGDDEDGPTKTFLTGRLVPKWLVSIAVYSR